MYHRTEKEKAKYFDVPASTVIAFAGENIPDGYLLCDGISYNPNEYPDLFNAIGTIYGGNGSTSFNVPDFRGMFLSGEGGAAEKLGKKQGDAIRNITGNISVSVGGNNGLFDSVEGAFRKDSNSNLSPPKPESSYKSFSKSIAFDASLVVSTANENRPVNYAVKYCIKY